MSSSADWDPYLRLVTIAEAAESVQRPESTIRRWISEGRITPLAYMGRQPLLRESDVTRADAARCRPRLRQWRNMNGPRDARTSEGQTD